MRRGCTARLSCLVHVAGQSVYLKSSKNFSILPLDVRELALHVPGSAGHRTSLQGLQPSNFIMPTPLQNICGQGVNFAISAMARRVLVYVPPLRLPPPLPLPIPLPAGTRPYHGDVRMGCLLYTQSIMCRKYKPFPRSLMKLLPVAAHITGRPLLHSAFLRCFKMLDKVLMPSCLAPSLASSRALLLFDNDRLRPGCPHGSFYIPVGVRSWTSMTSMTHILWKLGKTLVLRFPLPSPPLHRPPPTPHPELSIIACPASTIPPVASFTAPINTRPPALAQRRRLFQEHVD